MSTPQATRGQRGGSSTRGGRGVSNQASQGRGNPRGTTNSRGAPRGRARGASTPGVSGNARSGRAGSPSGEGLLHKLREGTARRGADTRTYTPGRGRGAGNPTPFTLGARGRGRGRGSIANNSQTFNTLEPQQSTPGSRAKHVPAPDRDFMNSKYTQFQTLKQSREEERAKAIRDGFLADPEKKTSLDKAITPVGTCTDMCPQFERVERIVQNMVDRAEKDRDEETRKEVPDEDRMVKRFRRSAAGYDEQLPSDIRTPATLKQTLDYLLDTVIDGADRLATVQKFVWDRTRGIRNDFSIQQVTKVPDVKLAVECFEDIARFHILSLHQLSNPDNLLDEEHFDAHQEREQLNNTLMSLIYYYNDHGDRINFPNEAEFRAYLIIFEIESQSPDIEDRMQSWSSAMLDDDRVKTAQRLYTAASNTMQPLGPLHPLEPAAVAQGNTGRFWNVLASKSVPYLMACLAEHFFHYVRFGALDALWRSGKLSPVPQQAKSREWTLGEVTSFLAFDSQDQTREFCAALDVSFAIDNDSGDEYLALTANTAKFLEHSSIPRKQVFSHKYVEAKRYRRSCAAVIKGFTVAESIRSGSTESAEGQEEAEHYADEEDDDQSMFVPEEEAKTTAANSSTLSASFDPTASPFTPGFGQSAISSPFGKPTGTGGFGSGTPTGSFGSDQPQKESTFGKTPSFGGFGSSTASTPAVPAPAFGKPAPSGGFGFSPTAPPFGGAASGFGKPTPEPQATPSTLRGFGSLPASPLSTSGQSASQQTQTPFQFGSFQPPKQPTPVQAPKFGSGTFSSSASLAPSPITWQNPSAQQASAPAPARAQEDKTTTNSGVAPSPAGSFQSLSSSAGFAQTSEAKPAYPLFASPDWFTSQSQSSQPTLTTGPALPSFTGATREPSPKANAVGVTQSQPFLTSDDTPKPSIENAPPLLGTTNPPSAPPGKSVFAPLPASPSPQPQRSTTPPYSPNQPPAKPVLTQTDRHTLAANLARIGFTQPNGGLLSSYLEVALHELLTTAFHQHQRELRVAAIASIRNRILARKFGHLWRQRAWNSSLNRRAKNRRQMFAETIRAEQGRKQRSEEELEQILKAAQESRRLQKEIEEAAKTPKKSPTMSNGVGLVKVAGQKRKSFSGQDRRASTVPSSNGAPSHSGHKRSKTMSGSQLSTSLSSQAPPVAGFRASISRPQQHASSFSRSSTLVRSTSNSSLRKSVNTQKLDATRTDYFRLKAMGVDPDTPMVPDTKETFALRRQREAEERQASIDRASRRVRTPTSDHISPTSMPPPPLPQARTPEAQPTVSRSSTPAAIESDLLTQLREVREAMAEQTEWFKDQSGALEKEIEQEEEFRRSQSSHEAGSPLSSSGLARINGYEYLPAETKPGFSLSRTELRIRQTGAHGLATKSLRSSSDYMSVAMSKRSAAKHRGGSYSSPGLKRSYDDVEPSDQTENAHQAALHALKRPRAVAQHSQDISQQKLKQGPPPVSRNGASNAFQLLQSVDPKDDDEAEDLDDEHDTDELSDEQDDEPGQPGSYPSYHVPNGDYADDEDEVEDLSVEDENDYGSAEDRFDEEEDDLDDEEEENDEGYAYPAPYLPGDYAAEEYDDAATPASNPQVSRAASSAPGGSVDDAFVIDDSD